MSSVVLDASALLAYLHDESGAEVVAEILSSEEAVISAANWGEVLSKVAELGEDPQRLANHLRAKGLLGGAIEVVPLTEADALITAQLRPLTRAQGLSLGDRACLALAIRLGLPVITADRTWAALNLDCDVRLIR